MSARRIRRLSLLAAVAALALPSVALAHAQLEQSTPGDGAVLATAPAAVRLVFHEVVQPARGDGALRNDGADPGLARPPPHGRPGRSFALTLPRPPRPRDY